MQTGIRFEKIPARPGRKVGEPETLRLRRQRSAAQTLRRRARRVANMVKGRF